MHNLEPSVRWLGRMLVHFRSLLGAEGGSEPKKESYYRWCFFDKYRQSCDLGATMPSWVAASWP